MYVEVGHHDMHVELGHDEMYVELGHHEMHVELGKRAVVYFLLNYLEASGRVFDNAFMPLNLKATT
jgi:hypothetical protein